MKLRTIDANGTVTRYLLKNKFLDGGVIYYVHHDVREIYCPYIMDNDEDFAFFMQGVILEGETIIQGWDDLA